MTEIEERRRRHSALETIDALKKPGESDENEEVKEESSITATDGTKKDADMDGLSGAMSALKFVPPSVRFGRGGGHGRGGFSRS